MALIRGDNRKNTLIGTAAADTIFGLADIDVLQGGNGNDLLDGGTGNDTLIGGWGNDTFIIDGSAEIVTELTGQGTDVVHASVNHTLAANVEVLLLLGAALNGTGNALANTITGNALSNKIDGGAGGDKLIGGLGNDTYVVGSALDMVTESMGQGTDAVLAWINHTLAANVEVLTLLGSAQNGTGNALENTITGNSLSNKIDGGAGGDQLAGGLGDDTYVVGSSLDVVTELAGQGTDTVHAWINHSLAANVENLTLLGGALNGFGNALANVITGNALANRLDGGAGGDTLNGGGGADQMTGGLGDDTYIVDNDNDTIVESSGGGTDTIQTSVSIGLAADVENAVLLASGLNVEGNALANVITGSSGADLIEGGDGADTLIGGAGDDTFLPETSDNPTMLFADDISGGEGFDTVDYRGLSFFLPPQNLGIQIDLAAGTSAYGTGGDTFSSIEKVIGTTWKDAFHIVNGGTAIGGGHDDLFQGDYAGSTSETFQGDAGNDQFFLYANVNGTTHAADVIADFVKGQDLLVIDTTNFWAGAGLDKTQPFGGALLTFNADGLPNGIVAPQFVYGGGKLYFSANGDPASGSIIVAEFLGNIGGQLAQSDFAFI